MNVGSRAARFLCIGITLGISCGSLNTETRTGVLAGPKATLAPGNGCPSAGPPVPNAHPAQAVANTTAAFVQTCDRAGGWGLELPLGWFERWSNQHGREILSYNPAGMNFNDGSYPEPGQIFIRLQMVQNPERFAPAEFERFLDRGGSRLIRAHHQVTIAGQPADEFKIWESRIPPYAYLETNLQWYVRSPFFDDRMVVITATPADSPLRPEAEHLVASLRFFEPTAVNLIPTKSRSEIMAQVSSRPGLALTRIEAKLVLRKDLDATGKLGRDFYSDPDALAWVVAFAGSGIYGVNFGGPPAKSATSTGMPTPGVCLSTVDIYPADDQPGMTASGGCDTKQSWPAWFDALPNRG
jgi:hypothetical protein